MFVGHYSAALAAKAIEPRAPLWTYVIAAQFVDIGWSAFVMGGLETVRIDKSLAGSTLVLESMPWTHSLPAAAAWSIIGGLLTLALLKSWRCSLIVGAVVFSHWLLDLAVHRPDLELWFGGTKVGFGLWNFPVPEQALEIGLLGVAGMYWAAQRVQAGRPVWPAAVFVGLLVVVQVAAMFSPPAGDPMQIGMSALGVYLLVGAAAWLVERGQGAAGERLRARPERA